VDTISQQAARLSAEWATDARWKDTSRTYSAEDVIRLRGSVQEEYTLARLGGERLRKLLEAEDAVTALGAVTGLQAVQQVRAGLKAIYLSGWQVAADANLAGQTYPDQSLYPVNSVPQDQQRAAARRPDHLVGVGGRRHAHLAVLAGTHRGRRRSRIRRRAERV
jgi:isocitrate lyase